eukprot:355947-Chlamydomonas_euryale.AAC.3
MHRVCSSLARSASTCLVPGDRGGELLKQPKATAAPSAAAQFSSAPTTAQRRGDAHPRHGTTASARAIRAEVSDSDRPATLELLFRSWV